MTQPRAVRVVVIQLPCSNEGVEYGVFRICQACLDAKKVHASDVRPAPIPSTEKWICDWH